MITICTEELRSIIRKALVEDKHHDSAYLTEVIMDAIDEYESKLIDDDTSGW